MTVVNTGQETYHLTTDTVRCCQIVTPQDTHCQRMDLVGGDMGSIPGGVHTNITFIIPTIVSTMTGGGDTYERGVALVLPFLSRANQRPIPINMASQLSLTDKTPLYKGFN
uniref:Uncharacterized protein n=1 Tax=Timema bartmani TaxID=61472 RepID=A0A7R9EU42_9NEOP|nr:unnamed protein product [Timema bartmani]